MTKSWETRRDDRPRGDRVDDVAWEAIDFFGLNEGGLDVARLVGFVVLSVLVIGLLLTWTWRFRREFWHRNNVLLLLSLLLLVRGVRAQAHRRPARGCRTRCRWPPSG